MRLTGVSSEIRSILCDVYGNCFLLFDDRAHFPRAKLRLTAVRAGMPYFSVYGEWHHSPIGPIFLSRAVARGVSSYDNTALLGEKHTRGEAKLVLTSVGV